MPNKPLTYRAAGVDLDAKAKAFERVKAIAKTASRPETLGKLGSFGGMFALGPYEEPILVSSIDGVGTKLKIAVAMDKHDSVGYDIVAHCANDIAAQGAEPLFFLDYIGMGRLKPDTVESLIEGVARGCREVGCALIGGETAEMPDLYADGDYDLAGCIVGVVERSQAVTGESIRPGCVVVGFPSAGLHTNGFSLARKALLEAAEMALDDPLPELQMSVGEALLVSHRSYARSCLALHREAGVLGFAHITGGGLMDNLSRNTARGMPRRPAPRRLGGSAHLWMHTARGQRRGRRDVPRLQYGRRDDGRSGGGEAARGNGSAGSGGRTAAPHRRNQGWRKGRRHRLRFPPLQGRESSPFVIRRPLRPMFRRLRWQAERAAPAPDAEADPDPSTSGTPRNAASSRDAHSQAHPRSR